MEKAEHTNKLDPAALIRQNRMVELHADLARALAQLEVVKQRGVRDSGAVFRQQDIEAWIDRVETELKTLEKGV